MPGIFHHQFTVPAEAIDENKHVNNVVYVQWMQDAAVLHSNAQGCTREAYERLRGTWVVRTHKIDYLRPTFAGDRIQMLTWISNLRRSSSLRKYKFLRESDQAVLAQAETDWVYVNMETGRPCAIHDEVKDAFEVVPAEDEP